MPEKKADAAKPHDLIISYAVVSATCEYQDGAVLRALQEGYRVADIVMVPLGGGGGAAVTVFLTTFDSTKKVQYLGGKS